MTPIVTLKPGDIMLYRPSGILGWVIATKTWHRFGHVEIAVKPGFSISARAEGVNLYPTRWNKLGAVMRPTVPLNIPHAMEWFNVVKGAPYDALALLRFFRIGKTDNDNAMFCSQVCSRWLRVAGCNPFHGIQDDLIPPGWFYTMGDNLECVWSDEQV